MKVISGILTLLTRVLAILGAGALFVAFLVFSFVSRTSDQPVPVDLPPTAIVFTGDFARIHTGLDLLSSGEVYRLFVTGVNGDAGLNVDRFAKQFELSPEQAGWIETGRISLAPNAHTTFENALEAACWLDQQSDVDAVTLITSREHMARASVALEHAIGRISVVRVISNTPKYYEQYQLDLKEFGEFSATWFVTLLPRSFWPTETPEICQGD